MVADLVAREVVARLKTSSLNERKIRAGYRVVKTEPELQTLFHELSIDLQTAVINWISMGAKMDSILTLIRLMHRMGYNSGILSSWVYTDSSHKPVLYSGPDEIPSASLVLKIREFSTLLKDRDYESYKTLDIYYFVPVFFFLLRTIHGEDRIMEMLDYWMSNIEHFSYSRFEEIAKSWDNVKHLPIEWTFSITDAK